MINHILPVQCPVFIHVVLDGCIQLEGLNDTPKKTPLTPRKSALMSSSHKNRSTSISSLTTEIIKILLMSANMPIGKWRNRKQDVCNPLYEGWSLIQAFIQ